MVCRCFECEVVKFRTKMNSKSLTYDLVVLLFSKTF